jgi:ferritin-like metal-binding protein YciE
MPQINNLLELLIKDIKILYAAEEQIEKAMPGIIAKVHHSSLKNALTHHLNLSSEQKLRLEQIPALIHKVELPLSDDKVKTGTENKGIKGLLEEANEVLGSGLAPEVNDAAIIACVQKIEHYEICGYGTALAYAEQLKLHKVSQLLTETLDEEYDADDLLTALAKAALNKEAITEEIELEDRNFDTPASGSEDSGRPAKVSISERNISSPGGRAGTSHRGYSNGESRGH